MIVSGSRGISYSDIQERIARARTGFDALGAAGKLHVGQTIYRGEKGRCLKPARPGSEVWKGRRLETGAAQPKDAEQEPSRGEGVVPLP